MGVCDDLIVERDAGQPYAASGGPLSLVLPAPVEMIEPTGAETIVLLRLGGERVLGRSSPDVRPAAGAPWRFAVDTGKICLFDPTTGNLIP